MSPFRALLWFALALPVATPVAAESEGMKLTGFHDLQGRGAYQPVIHRQGERWIAYVGHHAGRARNPLSGKLEDNGTSLIDVSDPAKPRLLHHIPGGPGGEAQMVRVCDGKTLPRAPRDRVYMLRTRGHDAHEVWDVTLPEPPQRVAVVADNLHGTHKNWWECDTGIAYLVSGVPGWRTSRMTQIFDLGDPRQPRFIRNYGLEGQQPGASGAVPTGLHGAISTGPAGNRVYFGHGTSSGGILQIVDREKLLKGKASDLRSPQVGRYDLDPSYGAHTAFPLTGMEFNGPDGRKTKRDFVAVINEALADGCGGPRQKVWFIDVGDEARPHVASTWELDDLIGDYCKRPGRIGAHSSNESFTAIYYRRILFIAHFNAGVRALDIRNPYMPREIAFFVPEGGGRTVTTNNVEVDDRGYIYIVDRHGLGMHVLELTGKARRVANFP
ncbi:MAG: LVIVD repeat-containing protein [Burkholderiales bacterium]